MSDAPLSWRCEDDNAWPVAMSMVGRLVTVLLGVQEDGSDRTVVGVLVSLAEEGDFVIDTPEGRLFCWPAMAITAAALTAPPS